MNAYNDNPNADRHRLAGAGTPVGSGMNFPDVEQCLQYMEEFAMLPNIRRHSIVVARVALTMVEELIKHAPEQVQVPDRDIVLAGALLHDIAKTQCLQNDCDHAREGAQICTRLGYPDIARIVGEHVILKDFETTRYQQGIFAAREIIYYADKRVRHEEIVSLDDRLEYILENYGMDDQVLHGLIKENFDKCFQLEQYFFSFLPFAPDLLAEKVLESSFDAELAAFYEASKVR